MSRSRSATSPSTQRACSTTISACAIWTTGKWTHTSRSTSTKTQRLRWRRRSGSARSRASPSCPAQIAAAAAHWRAARESWTSSTRGRPRAFCCPTTSSIGAEPSQGIYCSSGISIPASCSAPRIRSGTIFGRSWRTNGSPVRRATGSSSGALRAARSRSASPARKRKSTTRIIGSPAENWRPLRSCRGRRTSHRGCTGGCTATKIVQRGLGASAAPTACTCCPTSPGENFGRTM
mmetsp:Transcript_2168/g.5037  ORF Transcript_2168/g.5037 Transcript_2168/m.5037 type:complete len:235 (-) Transcript_2168:165-869(-)